jgi:transcriptional regulator with XRE-family HTH domain
MNLRTARRLKDITQAQLATRAGVDQTTISDIERGRNTNPSWATVVRLAQALDVAPEELFPLQPAPTPESSKDAA